MELLDSPIRAYAWGSRTAIAAIQGRAANGQPEAELWMGAHPDSPSMLTRHGEAVRLDNVLAASRELLGDESVSRFGPRLPFMLKVLAAESPLSLQAHPDAETAARRFAEESGRPSADRLYTDPYAKPELLVAVEAFDTLCGFRDPSISADILDSLRVEALAPIVTALRTGTDEVRLRTAVDRLLRWPSTQRAAIVSGVTAAARRRGLDYIADLGDRFPADMGVVVALLCHRVRLDAGEAIWMPDGNLHAYLRGTGVELLASSDNVLRGGFTTKRVDIDELLRVLSFQVLSDPLVKPVPLGPGLVTWPVPAPEFALIQATVTPDGSVEIPVAGPRIAFCLRGAVTLDDGVPISIAGGQSVFGAAGRPLSVRGDGVVFVASTGQ